MEAKDINSLNDCQRYLEGCINDFEGGVSTKEEALKALREYTERITDLAFTAAGKWNDPKEGLPKYCADILIRRRKNNIITIHVGYINKYKEWFTWDLNDIIPNDEVEYWKYIK